MKKIEAIIRPEKLDEVLAVLDGVSYSGIMITEIKGHGKQKGLVQQWRGEQYRVSLLTKMKIEIVAADKEAAKIRDVIAHSARTGEIGDGKIFISEVGEAVRIRTGESGEAVV